MATNEVVGVGSEFRRWNSTSAAWEVLGTVVSIDPALNMSRATIETTNLQTTGGYRTRISAKLRDAGPISFVANFNRDDYEKLKTDYDSDDEQNYEIVLPDEDVTSLEFVGFVTEMPLSVSAADELITMNVTIEIDGAPTIESGSGPSVSA